MNKSMKKLLSITAILIAFNLGCSGQTQRIDSITGKVYVIYYGDTTQCNNLRLLNTVTDSAADKWNMSSLKLYYSRWNVDSAKKYYSGSIIRDINYFESSKSDTLKAMLITTKGNRGTINFQEGYIVIKNSNKILSKISYLNYNKKPFDKKVIVWNYKTFKSE